MHRIRTFGVLLLAILPGLNFSFFFQGNCASAEESGGAQAVASLPKVPARALILKEGGSEDTRIAEWIQTLLAGKEKRASVELEVLKKKILSDETARAQYEREKQRRRDKYDDLNSRPANSGADDKPEAIHIKLEFQVPEISTYRYAAETCLIRERLANDVVERLSHLDRNQDGVLSSDEYRAAGAILISCANLLKKMDGNENGYLTESDISVARTVPRNASAAEEDGSHAAEASGYRIKPYDMDNNGELDVNERKALAMAFVDVSVRAGQDAAFYTRMADSLVTARAAAAQKYADIEIAP